MAVTKTLETEKQTPTVGAEVLDVDRDRLLSDADLLSAKVVASKGGETEFTSTYAAYDDLSEEEKQRFDGLRVHHCLEAARREAYPDPTPEQLAQWRAKTKEHPLVWTHQTGRKSLVL